MNFYKYIDFVEVINNRNLNIYRDMQVNKRLIWK
jgi:hypothetical protein